MLCRFGSKSGWFRAAIAIAMWPMRKRAQAPARDVAPPQGSSNPPVAPTPRRFDIPTSLQEHFRRWGPNLLHRLAAAGCPTPQVSGLRVGTDCSGLEAPVLALRALNVAHRHVFSSEVNDKKRQYIKTNFASASPRGNPQLNLSPDMLSRDHQSLPLCDLYVCGFPCKPFSKLHHKSLGLREKEARPFTAVLKTLRAILPAVAVLENVRGIAPYLPKIWARLRSLQWYEVLTVEIDPATMGEPVSRPRFCFHLGAGRRCEAQLGRVALQVPFRRAVRPDCVSGEPVAAELVPARSEGDATPRADEAASQRGLGSIAGPRAKVEALAQWPPPVTRCPFARGY